VRKLRHCALTDVAESPSVNSLVFTWIYILIVLNVNRCETSGRVFCVVVKLVTVSVSRSLKAIKLTEVSDILLLN